MTLGAYRDKGSVPLRDIETIIVGGGPAGSSCAWALRKHGRECAILERQALPKSKLCAGWITPKVIADLDIDVRHYPHGMLELKKIRVYFGRSRWSIAFATRQYSIRRIQFDNWLLDRSGAEVIGHPVRSIRFEDGYYVIDELFRCRYLVGAGGTNCPVKRTFFRPEQGQLIITQEIEYEASAKDPVCTLFYPYGGMAGYGWYVPKADGINIGFGGVASQFGKNIKSLWQDFTRTLAARGLIDSPPPEPSSYPYYVGDRRKKVREGNAFIVGDAAGLATIDIGEGIGPAVESGLAAAREILALGTYAIGGIPSYTLEGLPGKVMARLISAY